jgi:polysaccharide biosynthesis transport protein
MQPQTKDIRDYLLILKKRKKYFLIPAVLLFSLVIVIAKLLPSIYESSSTILIENQQIPEDFVRSTVTGFADQRIQSLTQQILSRTKLLEIIKQFKLYPEMQEKYTQEEIIEKMKDDIKFDTISADVVSGGGSGSGSAKRRPSQAAAVTIAFTIAYQGKDPGSVQKVTGTLASLYLEQNLKNREAQAQSTTQFLQAELKELEERIRVVGGKITAFKDSHEGTLPELAQFNLGQAERLENEIKQLDNNIRNAEDRKIYLEGQLITVQPDTPLISGTGERILDPKSRLQVLEVVLADLRSKFSEDHPDIQKTLRETAQLKKLTGSKGGSAPLHRQKLTQLQAELAQIQGKYTDQHPEIRKLKDEIAQLEKSSEKVSPRQAVTDPGNPAYISMTTQIQAANADIAAIKRQRQDLQSKLQMYRKRLEETPKVEQEYLALQRDYQNAHSKYQEIMNKLLEARISEGMEEHQKGEKFTIIDPAAYPEKPIKPKRLLITLAGLIFSLGVGLGTVALKENLDHSVKTAEELAGWTGIPILGTISRIWTKQDVAQRRRKKLIIFGSTCLSLGLGLILFHFLYMDLWVLSATVMRLANKYF